MLPYWLLGVHTAFSWRHVLLPAVWGNSGKGRMEENRVPKKSLEKAIHNNRRVGKPRKNGKIELELSGYLAHGLGRLKPK
jgi:hypothetical protein